MTSGPRVLLDELTGRTPGQVLDQRSLEEAYAAPRLPWLRATMVATLDGAATGETGTSGAIGNAVDRRVYDLLRSTCDAIVVGAGTARTEGYQPVTVPTVVVSRRGEVPPLLAGGPTGSVLLATTESSRGLARARDELGDGQVLVAGDQEVDLRRLVGALHRRGWQRLLCEGGPSLLADMVAAGLVDELDLTVVPRLLGGNDRPRIVAGSGLDVDARPGLLLENGGTVLGRWLLGQ